ncbi:LOW QUALITY PROTEIN: proline-rich protein 35 [Erpetoichthys calabaricus]|uniref:LOW QUALITY PROTEIN: proline-rich protein 35 n=1 Tax=Erpetoichthys calabaricus TaxID=27687 RepID=UPI00109EFBB3|nr:LOW QUALITY PROTEIN: proline-rich protein 35 [Erpetoichthys calabaricus]
MSAAPDMSKEASAAFKHKERKPKKPHYIPRPWGKPYNYKCFQCPFTCMEKSHLYNHMKYSLCKNSLSLLIESDWPYKKGNLLALQSGSRLPTEADHVARNEEPKASAEVERDTRENEVTKGEEPQGERQGAPQSGQKATELVIADVYSLEDPVLSARAVEAKLRHYKLPQSCVNGPSVLSEQWRLIATGQRKGNPEPALDAVSMPCYPPPPAYTDCQDPPGLNVSVLGVSYPLSPGLFSYVNPPVTSAQLPFLASAAQLLHPSAGTIQHTDRAVLPPHFYYPLLCEHALSSIQEPGKESKGAQPLQATLEPKISLWKVPALKASPPVPAVPPAAWPSRQQLPAALESSYKAAAADEKHPSASKEDRAVSWSHQAVTATVDLGSKRTATPADHLTAPPEKKPAQRSASLSAASEKPPLHSSSFRPPIHQLKSSEDGPPGLWRHPLEVYEKMTAPSAPESAQRPGQDGAAGDSRVLLGDLSRALQEYREADKKIASLVLDDIPGQRYLRAHLCKIRSELSHIHQALDETAKQHEGPLDLSVKRRAEKGAKQQGAKQQSAARDEDEEAEVDEEHEDTGDAFEQFVAGIRPADRPGVPRATLGALVKTEVVSPGSLGVRPPPGEAPVWPSRTTKCEADSSVLLCPDGRSSSSSSVVFADFSGLRRTAIRDLPGDAAGPPSPLSTD